MTNDLEFDIINELSLRSKTKAPAGTFQKEQPFTRSVSYIGCDDLSGPQSGRDVTLEAGRTEQKPEGFRGLKSFQKTFEKKLKKFLTKQSRNDKI